MRAALLALLLATPAFAQDAADPFGTIIVTARKRAEPQQSVPIAISSFDAAAVDRLQIKTIEDLRYATPSLYVQPSNFRQDVINITIRGQQNFQSNGLQFDTSAAVYVNGVYYARPLGLTGSLFDVDTVQVLKGPQGTLVGRNTTGGAIFYETKQPARDFGGYVRSSFGDYGLHTVQGALNLPLTANLAVRAAFNYDHSDGYIRNYYVDPVSGARNDTPAMGYRKLGGIFSAKWTPADWSILLRANVSDEHYTGQTYTTLGSFIGTTLSNGRPSVCNIPATCLGFTDLRGSVITPYYANYLTGTAVSTLPSAYNSALALAARAANRSFWSTEQAINNRDEGRYQTLSATIDRKLGQVDARLIAAYRWFDATGASQNRGLPYVTNVYAYDTPDYRSWQADLTFNGHLLADTLKWTAGAFGFRETSPTDGDQLWLFLPSGIAPAAASGRQITYTDATRNGERNSSYAAYGQLTYTLTPHTRLTAGARYTIDHRYALLATQTIRFPATPPTTATVPNGVYDPGSYTLLGITYTGLTRACALTDTGGRLLSLDQCRTTVTRTYRRPTWTVAVDQDVARNTLAYATARSGYRSGAINSAAINPAVITAKPERVTDYEIGLKSDWRLAGVPLRTNFAAYWTDYRDIQIQTTLPNVTIATAPGDVCTQALFNAGSCTGTSNDNVTLNARRARVRGFEFDVQARPLKGLTLQAAGSYLDAVYSDYSFTPPPGYLLPTGTTNLSGTRFPLPKWQLNGSMVYARTTPLGALELSWHSYWQSHYEADLRAFNPAQATRGYALSDLRVALGAVLGSRFDISAGLKNVFNKAACVPEPQGVLNSAPNGTFGVAGTSGVLQCMPLAPRTLMGTVAYRF
ncbi:iron complex outermembrane receptor protein [Sphingomonas vulcanisoli]|uniref:Iron complex outermembrane receptor protein n=1 Tax=Sphingomonas vulcanisoli TaxID=1658060 RepID=A0ABX0TTP8_9SPHN|nr:TonB-dependent receptor [Sphingomonas vulcanisoli]NIJ07782.1 iron complex outermembrane receptor protein [Sphingomonas vulcanisoli]